MASGGQINTEILSDEIFDIICSMCKNQGINTEADKFCVDCHDYFCGNCVKVHSKVPLCAGHKVLDRSQVKSGTSKGLPRAPTERCDRHSHKYIDMYCQNHDKVGCSTCLAVDHRYCKDIFYIPEFIQNKSYQVDQGEIQTKLKSLAKTLAEQADRFKQNKQWLLKRKTELLADIKKYRQEINDQIDKLEKNSVDDIEDKVKCLESKFEESLKQLKLYKAKVTSATDKLVSPNQNQAEVFVNMKMGEDAANVAIKCLVDTESNYTLKDLEFRPHKTILKQLEQTKALGTLREKPTHTDGTLFQIKGQQSYCVKIKSDEQDCYITGACCMEDGTIILADKINRKLRRLHNYNYIVKDYCDLPGHPHQVCMINNTQVAVTLPSQQEVHFVSLEGDMETTNKINTDFECFGLAYINNNLHISDGNTSVYMYTLPGKKLSQLSKNQSGHKQFSNIYSLAVSKDATRIYVADGENGLIVLDNNGQVVSTYHGKKLQRATCCFITDVGSLLVSGENSYNVLQFTSDGVLIGEVIKADGRRSGISSVCCNQQMSRIFISRRDSKNNIEVYTITRT